MVARGRPFWLKPGGLVCKRRLAGKGDLSRPGGQCCKLRLAMSHAGHVHPPLVCRAVLLSELPAEWRRPVDPATLRSMAVQLGQPAVEAHTVFLLPQLPITTEYMRWYTSMQPDDARRCVGVCLQSREAWMAQAAPGSLRFLVQSLRTRGHPDFASLGRVFSGGESGGGGPGGSSGAAQ
jgi:hypothetical protein